MRQHAILSCLLLLTGWALFFGMTLFNAIYAIPNLQFSILMGIIIPTSVGLMGWQRQKLKHIVFRANVWGFMGLLCLFGLRLFAELQSYTNLQITAILLMPTFIVLGSLGLQAFWICLFPALALLFAHPGLMTFPEWTTQQMITLMRWLTAWPVNAEAMPLLHYSLHAMVLTAFYAYLRYAGFGQRFGFYAICAGVFFSIAAIQAFSLSGLHYYGGQDLISQFNIGQFNQVLVLLGVIFLAYALSVLFPYRPPMRRMMNGSQTFMILVDRHSHWFALTLTTLLLMALSVWLGSNIYQMSLSVMEIWHQ